jgi:hypothetical protein
MSELFLPVTCEEVLQRIQSRLSEGAAPSTFALALDRTRNIALS